VPKTPLDPKPVFKDEPHWWSDKDLDGGVNRLRSVGPRR
jgi:hypothetical protein